MKIDFDKKYYIKRINKTSPFKDQLVEGKMKFIQYIGEHKKGVILQLDDDTLHLILNPETHNISECGFRFEEINEK